MKEPSKFKIIKLYKSGLTLRQVAVRIGCSMQNVHQIIKKYEPHIMKQPYKGY